MNKKTTPLIDLDDVKLNEPFFRKKEEKNLVFHEKLNASKNLTAKEFIKALRSANTRQEKVDAINSYTGWNSKYDYGTNESLALAKANKEVRPIKAEEFKRSQVSIEKPYVAGVCSVIQKKIDDLKCRRKICLETIREIELELNIKKTEYLLKTLSLEKERLSNINKELISLK